MKVAIVGAGLIGCERIEAVQLISKTTDISISSVFDVSQETLAKVKDKYNVNTVSSLEESLDLKPDWVFIATPNDVVADTSKQAFSINANVLVEKPFGRSFAECEDIISAKPNNCDLYVGFNYRFFAGIEAALHDAKQGKFGDLISVNLILGHGNSPGMEKSWRFTPEKYGDCVTDLGVHLFDLILQLSNGDISVDFAKTWMGFWNTGIEEEAHMMFSDKNGTIFNAQTSFNRWRSTFKLEINGTEGYGIVENRGRSYGPQTYRTGVRWGWLSGKSQSESETIVIDKDDCKDSFIKETISVLGIQKHISNYHIISSACTYKEAKDTMCILEKVRELI